MLYAIDMRRLHQGCGESLQSKLPASLIRCAQLPGPAQGQCRCVSRIRSTNRHPRDEREYR
jgi:hypothetical protein